MIEESPQPQKTPEDTVITSATNKDSFLGFCWQLNKIDESRSLAISQRTGLSTTVANILSTKDISLESIELYLEPRIKHEMPNPSSLLDMDLAAENIIEAIKNNKKVTIFGDYDVDGATSSAILKKFFKMVNFDSDIYIPDRVKEGYGPNTDALLALKKAGTDLVITVDCGTVAFEPAKAAKDAGLDVIIIDHHIGTKEKPESVAVVNPNRFDEITPLTYLCGAGVSFMLAVAVNKVLRESLYYKENDIKEPNLLSLLDLVALGTVADVVPLVGLNRAFVSSGLKAMKNWSNIGLQAIKETANITDDISEYTLGFIIGPRINAGGRLKDSSLGARLLSSEDKDEAREIAKELEELNIERKEIEAKMLEEAIAQIEAQNLHSKPIVAIASKDYHQGVIGIIASRVKEKYNKPTAIMSINDGICKASCRSIHGVDIGNAILSAHSNKLLICGGGHAMAGGFSVEEENLSKLLDFMNDYVEKDVAIHSAIRVISFSSHISAGGVNMDTYQDITKLSPFGSANSKPKFMIKNIAPIRLDIRKDKHLSVILKDNATGNTVKGIMFNAMTHENSSKLLSLQGKEIDVICEINLNKWLGKESAEILIQDIAF